MEGTNIDLQLLREIVGPLAGRTIFVQGDRLTNEPAKTFSRFAGGPSRTAAAAPGGQEQRAAAGLATGRHAAHGAQSSPPAREADRSQSLRNGQTLLRQYRVRDGVEENGRSRPPDADGTHLPDGRRETAVSPAPAARPSGDQTAVLHPPPASAPRSAGTAIRHYPDIGLAALAQSAASAYRVWLLARLLDAAGRGWLSRTEMRQRLCAKASAQYLCGWRRLRQILAEGEGLFWQHDGQQRLWLRGVARVAARLAVGRLRGWPVALPLTALTEGMGRFKAHLYAAFHSGRKKPAPLSRTVQQGLTGVAARTQRHYCQVVGVPRQRNIAIGEPYSTPAAQEQAWQRGGGLLRFVDKDGRVGRPGGEYVAWQLPSSHGALHRRCPGGRRRKI